MALWNSGFFQKTLWYHTKEFDLIVPNDDLELGKAWKQGDYVNIIQVGLFILPSECPLVLLTLIEHQLYAKNNGLWSYLKVEANMFWKSCSWTHS